MRSTRVHALLVMALLLLGCQAAIEGGPPPHTSGGSGPLGAPTRSLARTPTPRRIATRPDRDAAPTPEAEASARSQPTGMPSAATWDQVEARARAEGHVVLYSDTSRSSNAVESLMTRYPGLRAESLALGSYDLYLRLAEDLQRGDLQADVYLASDPPRTLGLLAEGKLVGYVPPFLEDVLPAELREPLLTHHWSAVMVIASGLPTQTPPIDNWWDLTRPEWRGKVALPDPTINDRSLYLLATLTQHAEELAEAYRVEFGGDLVLDGDCANAGYQWIKGLLGNQPLLTTSDAEVAGWVADPQAGETRLGVCGYEQYAKVSRGELSFVPLPDIAPAAGMRWRTYLGLVEGSRRPYAARLLVSWLMGDAEGGNGYAAWHEPGFYPARSDRPDPPGGVPRSQLEPRLWELDPAYLSENMVAVRDHIGAHIGRP